MLSTPSGLDVDGETARDRWRERGVSKRVEVEGGWVGVTLWMTLDLKVVQAHEGSRRQHLDVGEVRDGGQVSSYRAGPGAADALQEHAHPTHRLPQSH